MDPKVLKALGSAVIDIAGDKKVQKVVLGTYTDGTTRSVVDALSGEFLSGKDREKYLKEKKKKKKHKKKKKDIWNYDD